MSGKSLIQIFFWPSVLGVLMMLGLIVTLLLEGGWLEQVSILALGIPVIVMIYIYCLRGINRY